MKPVWIIDFDDSFTYNIASEFYRLGFECEVIEWKKWQPPTTQVPKLLVLGPGPGHPDEYQREDHLLQWWKTQVPIAGLCLGHQMLARFLGLRVERAVSPMHGEAVELSAPMSWQKRFQLPSRFSVQRYNSLGVKKQRLPADWEGWEHEEEWIGFAHKRAISYQFHPESVGTSCPEAFFKTMTSFIL
jgi:anthranilate/para-aminobenzoate synthase component II